MSVETKFSNRSPTSQVGGFEECGGHLQTSDPAALPNGKQLEKNSNGKSPGKPCWLLYLELFGEVVSHDGGEGGEEGSQEHADVADVDGDVEEVQHVVNRC